MNGIRMPGLYPLMVGYALLYVSIPVYRALRLQQRNAVIKFNNGNREMWADFVHRMQDKELRGKISDVAQHSKQNNPNDGGPKQIIYTTNIENNWSYDFYVEKNSTLQAHK